MTGLYTGLPRLVGLSGRARSGKDTAAGVLVREFGYRRIAWADVLRECALAVNPIVGWDLGGPKRWADLFHGIGYEAAKDHPVYGPEFRRVLLTMGTEMGRNILGENTWVNATLDRMDPDLRYVVADTRFVNEAEAITTRGGAVIRIERPSTDPGIPHPSETSLDHWDFDARIKNDGTEADFYLKVRYVMNSLSSPGRWQASA